MSMIHVLDTQTANSIAAGEVVERPASVVKELLENALDAGASVISVEIRQGGIQFIRVTDNGVGMDETDAILAFDRHATSKMNSIEDLDALHTMGFRGEALASIAAVSHVRLETRPIGSDEGTLVQIEAGRVLQIGRSACAAGTVITIEQLFFNTPARFKFLKKDQTEAGQVADVLERMALARPDVSFRMVNNGQEILHTPGNNDLLSAVFAVYGKDVAAACLPVYQELSPVRVSGLITRPDQSRNNRSRQNFFVNGRLIRSKVLSAALDEACQTWFMKGRYTQTVLSLDVPLPLVDVNVHPQKMEVRFWDDSLIFRAVFHAVRQALIDGSGIPGESAEQASVDRSAEQTATDLANVNLVDQQLSADTTGQGTPTPVDQAKPLNQIIEKQTESDDPFNITPSSNPDGHLPLLDSQNTLPGGQTVLHEGIENQTDYAQTDFACDRLVDPVESAPLQLEDQSSSVIKINALSRAKLIGSIFNTYLLLELDDDMLLIDQHAAHERILYERLVNNRQNHQEIRRQNLLVPETITVSRAEQQALAGSTEQLLALGFEYEPFGPTSIILRSIPAGGSGQLIASAAFRIVLDALLEHELDQPEKINILYHSIACKAAVKAHDILDPAEMEQLLHDLRELENPYHCPHGRPVLVRISRHELEKRFKRIV